MNGTDLELPREAYLSWLEVDLEAIRHNYRTMRAQLQPGTAMFAVIKADAYGHGAVRVAQALLAEKPEMFCVARVEEAIELRRAGITTPLLVLAPPLGPQAKLAAEYDCSIVVCDPVHIEAVAATGKPARVHLKVDIGMGRLGARPENVRELIKLIASHPQLELEGVMSHFPCADAKSRIVTEQQTETFARVVEEVRTMGASVRYFHTANSAAVMQHPGSHFTATRVGIALYGQYPSNDMDQTIQLRPAMSMRTTVAYVKEVPTGKGLSYGHTFTTQRTSRIATVPLGYADGYPRHASSRAEFLVRGQRVRQVGRVCMDHVLLDVTDVADVQIGNVVTAFGVDGEHVLRAEELADRAGTIGYEITTRVGKRLPKFYI